MIAILAIFFCPCGGTTRHEEGKQVCQKCGAEYPSY